MECAVSHAVCRLEIEHVRKGLAALQAALDLHCERMLTRQTVSPWLGERLPTETELAPDVYAHPRHLVLLEVFDYAFTDPARYCIGLSLHFLLMLCLRRTKQSQKPPTCRTRLPCWRPSSTCRTGASRRRKPIFLR